MDTPQEKPCSKCGIPKTLDAFRNDKHSKDGKTSRCRDCLKNDGTASCNSKKGTGKVPRAVQLSLLTEAPPRPRKPRTKKGS